MAFRSVRARLCSASCLLLPRCRAGSRICGVLSARPSSSLPAALLPPRRRQQEVTVKLGVGVRPSSPGHSLSGPLPTAQSWLSFVSSGEEILKSGIPVAFHALILKIPVPSEAHLESPDLTSTVRKLRPREEQSVIRFINLVGGRSGTSTPASYTVCARTDPAAGRMWCGGHSDPLAYVAVRGTTCLAFSPSVCPPAGYLEGFHAAPAGNPSLLACGRCLRRPV